MPKASITIAIGGTYNNKAVDKAKKAMQEFNLEAARHAGGMAQSFAKAGDSVVKLGANMEKTGAKISGMGINVTKATAPLAALGAAAIKMASDYENSVAKVYTIMDKQVMSTDEMSKSILDLSTATGKSATELADATYQALSASVATDKVAGFVEDAVKLSKAGFTETATAVDTLTTVINAYGYKAEDAQMISDRLVQTQNKGKTTVDELAQSIGQVIPTAAAYNVNLDNLCSSYVILTKQGINTANATTMLNGMMSELAKEGTTVNIGLQEMTGKTFGGLMEAGWSLGDVLQLLMDACHGNTEEFANLWGNVRASKGALAIANAGAEEFNSTMGDMAKSTGLCDKALEDLTTPAAKASKALNAMKNTGILLGEEILDAAVPALDKMAAMAQDLYEWFGSLDEGTRNNIVAFGGLAVASGPVLTIFGKLYGSVGKLVTKVGHGMQSIGSFAAAMKTAEAEMRTAGATSVSFGSKIKGAADKTGLMTKATGLLKGGLATLGIGAAVIAVGLIVDAYNKWREHTERVEKATTGLETAIGAAKTAYDGYTPAVDAASKALENSAASSEEALQHQAELADSLTEKWKDVGANSAMVDYYAGVIAELGNKGNLTKEEMVRLQTAVDGFNQLTGEGVTITDEFNGTLDRNKQAILDVADAWKEQAKAKAAQEALYEMQRQLIENEMAITSQARKMREEQDKYNASIGQGSIALGVQAQMYDIERGKMLDLTKATGSLNRTMEDYVDIMVDSQYKFETMEDALDSVGIHIEDLGDLTDEQLEAMRQKFDGTLGSIRSACYEQGVNIPEGLRRGIDEGANKPVESMFQMVSKAILMAKKTLKSESPSRVMRQLGLDADSGFSGGIDAGASGPAASMASLARAMISAVSGLPGQARQAGSGAASSMASGISSGSSGVYSAGVGLASDFGSGIGASSAYRQGQDLAVTSREGMKSVNAYNTGWNFVMGFSNGMYGPSLYNAAYSIGTTALNAIKHALGIASPSKKAEEVGRFFGEGAVLGMRSTEDAIAAESERMSEAMSLEPTFTDAYAGGRSRQARSEASRQFNLSFNLYVNAKNAAEARAVGVGLSETIYNEIRRREEAAI